MSDYFTGQIILFAGNYAIRGFALCEGQLLNINDNPALYSLLGNQFGGKPPTTFALPDLRGRLPIHQGQGPGLTTRYMGQMFGEETVGVSTASMAAHTHSVQASSQDADSFTPAATSVLAKSTTGMYTNSAPDTPMDASAVLATGNGAAPTHYNLMPYLALNYQICLNGVYPSRP
ncbi:MAG: tail fiber protein [Nitrospinota bacterium]|nr:tail fiber protein [Nitrospinota bacterium]